MNARENDEDGRRVGDVLIPRKGAGLPRGLYIVLSIIEGSAQLAWAWEDDRQQIHTTALLWMVPTEELFSRFGLTFGPALELPA